MKHNDDFISIYDWCPTLIKTTFRAKSNWRKNKNIKERHGTDYKLGRDEFRKIKAYIENDVPDYIILETFDIKQYVLNKVKLERNFPKYVINKLPEDEIQ